jgi:hypothetical protein
MPGELSTHHNQSDPPRQVVDLAPRTARRGEAGTYLFTSREHNSLVTARTVTHAEAAEKLLNDPPAASTRVAWMGPFSSSAVTFDTHDPRLDEAVRLETRKRRARQMREMQGFLDDVEGLLTAAGTTQQAVARGGLRSMNASTSPTNSGRTTPQAVSRASTRTSQRTSPTNAQLSSKAQAGSVKPPKALVTKTPSERQREEAEILTQSAMFERVEANEVLVSAYDGSTHERDELLQYNDFVYHHMAAVIASEESEEVSLTQSVKSDNGATSPPTRRPESLPALDQWNKLPPLVNDDGEPLDPAAIRDANARYNEAARTCSKRLIAYRCFRAIDFQREYQRHGGDAARQPPNEPQPAPAVGATPSTTLADQ